MERASKQAAALRTSPNAVGVAPRRLATPLELVESQPPGVRARQLHAEARLASLDHLRTLQLAIETVRDLSDAVVAGSDLYTPGLCDFAQRLTEDLLWKSKTLQSLSLRQSELAHTAQHLTGGRYGTNDMNKHR